MSWNNWRAQGHHFILSDTWNDDAEYLEAYGNLIFGSLAFKFGSSFQVRKRDELVVHYEIHSICLETRDYQWQGAATIGGYESYIHD